MRNIVLASQLLASLLLLTTNYSPVRAQTPACIEIKLTDKTAKIATLAPEVGTFVAAADQYQKTHYQNSVVVCRKAYHPATEDDNAQDPT